MAANAGYSAVIKASAEDANYTTLTLCGDCSVDIARDVLDITSYGDTSGKKIAGLKRFKGTARFAADDIDSGQDLFRAALAAGSDLYVQILTDGTNGYKAACLVTSVKAGAPVGGVATEEFAFEENGAWSEV